MDWVWMVNKQQKETFVAGGMKSRFIFAAASSTKKLTTRRKKAKRESELKKKSSAVKKKLRILPSCPALGVTGG